MFRAKQHIQVQFLLGNKKKQAVMIYNLNGKLIKINRQVT